MKPVLLIDFGSTYTKLTALDVDSERLLGTASSYTTVQSDINDGLQNALNELYKVTGKIDFCQRYACSSAAGGLRMVTSGLVPELTAEAARQASLGAGAKVVGVYSYELTEDDIEDIDKLSPDIFLLTGGTDGGNTECMLNNAKRLAQSRLNFPIVIAGNRVCARECERILSGREVHRTSNVMPRFNELCIEPAQEQIRGVFLSRIIKAKGLSKASDLIDGIMMPTPAAMMRAMEVLSLGTENECGIGDLVAVDLGGATTDVYSIADGLPNQVNTIMKGLPEPHSKRTVEGDIGMRYNIHGIVEATSINRVSELSGLPIDKCEEQIRFLSEHTDVVPKDEVSEALDFALASIAIETAMIRHAGNIEQVYTPTGPVFAQAGKDLTNVKQVIATGGALIHTKRTAQIVSHVLMTEQTQGSLRPKNANIYIDKQYILASMGLLCEYYPDVAIRIMKKELNLQWK